MKDELIEYHQAQKAESRLRLEEWRRGDPPAGMSEEERQKRVAHNCDLECFHERAIEWLKSQ